MFYLKEYCDFENCMYLLMSMRYEYVYNRKDTLQNSIYILFILFCCKYSTYTYIIGKSAVTRFRVLGTRKAMTMLPQNRTIAVPKNGFQFQNRFYILEPLPGQRTGVRSNSDNRFRFRKPVGSTKSCSENGSSRQDLGFRFLSNRVFTKTSKYSLFQ